MAKKKQNNRNGRLEEAVATLLHTQASFLARIAEMDRVTADRFARIEAILLEHSQILADHSHILAEHTRLLEALPEAVREKIGFKAP